jgi:3-phenylpropionate/trans-cinnamate dioxygenase ferredoxin reductase component
MTSTFVIVGAGMAGGKAAETLREEGFDGRVILLGAEPDRPYERPPLSKDYLRGEAERSGVYLQEDAGWYAEHDVELRTSTAVASLDVAGSAVVLEDGERVGYDALLLATGAEPRRLPIPGADLDGVHVLRTFEDSDVLRAVLDGGGRLVVIGAGWIGCEVTASARQRGMDVALVEPQPVPLERALGPELGAFYRDVHLDHGVEVRLGDGVEAIEGSGRAERVRTTDGAVLDCTAVVLGVGVAPRTGLAGELAVDNGILVDAGLRTSAQNVFAAGDVANLDHPLLGRLRVEHWANALEQGPAAARAMLGQDVTYDRVPYFFSDQYDVGMEYAGNSRPGDDVVFRGDPATREFIAFWLRDGRLVAGMNVNVWDVNEQIQALVGDGATVDPDRLRDPDVELDAVVAG